MNSDFIDNREQAPASEPPRSMAKAKPQLELPGDNRLISNFAHELGIYMRDGGVFVRNGEVVIYDEATARINPVQPQFLRSLVEQYCEPFYYNSSNSSRIRVRRSMSIDDARAAIIAPQFLKQLRELNRVNYCRQPVKRNDGRIALLPPGYDTPTGTLTIETVTFEENMDLETAKGVFTELLSEFCFTDPKRSIAVAVAGVIGFFAAGLLPVGSLRPVFVVLANGEGAGKTMLVKVMVFPTFGTVPIGTRPEREEEFEKVLLTQVREGKSLLFLDNLRGHLASSRLEAFVSSEQWSGRVLGRSESYVGQNLSTVFVTGNGLTLSPDTRRRSLIVELHLAVERAEDRVFSQRLDDEKLRSLRPKILAAAWALVRAWEAAGRPSCNREHSAFPAWGEIIGGIVESAGFGCCLETPVTIAGLDQDGDDMRRLVEAMAESSSSRTLTVKFNDLVRMACRLGCFEHVLGDDDQTGNGLDLDVKLSPSQRSKLGRHLQRYNKRQISGYRFVITDKGHARRFSVIPINSTQGLVQGETSEPHLAEMDDLYDVQEP